MMVCTCNTFKCFDFVGVRATHCACVTLSVAQYFGFTRFKKSDSNPLFCDNGSGDGSDGGSGDRGVGDGGGSER